MIGFTAWSSFRKCNTINIMFQDKSQRSETVDISNVLTFLSKLVIKVLTFKMFWPWWMLIFLSVAMFSIAIFNDRIFNLHCATFISIWKVILWLCNQWVLFVWMLFSYDTFGSDKYNLSGFDCNSILLL